MKKISVVIFAAVLVLCCVIWAIFGYSASWRRALDELNIPKSRLHAQELYDDHGGFHNDGQRLLRLTPEDPRELAAAVEAASWEELPLTEELRAHLYGGVSTDSRAEAIGLPEITEGRWKYIERGTEKTIGRASNYSLAICAAAEGVLYVYELDT